MVQTKMDVDSYQIIEYIDAVPTTSKQRKQLFENGEWVERTFIRIPVKTSNRYSESSELEDWCRTHYKNPQYLGRWFKIDGYIILDDRTYVHWKLCE